MDFKEYCNTFKKIDLINMDDEAWRFIGFFVEWALDSYFYDDVAIVERVNYIKKDYPSIIVPDSEKSYEDISILKWLTHLFWADAYSSFEQFSIVLEKNNFKDLSRMCREYLKNIK